MTLRKQMYHDILITTDGSDGTTEAIRHGLEVAERDGATVHLLYVMDDVVRRRVISLKSHQQLAVEERKRAERAIRDLTSVANEYDVDVVTNVRTCWPYVLRDKFHRTIVNYSERNEIDLIVMGMQERTGLRRLLKGSVTRRVVTNTEIPVLTTCIPIHEVGEPNTIPSRDPSVETG